MSIFSKAQRQISEWNTWFALLNKMKWPKRNIIIKSLTLISSFQWKKWHFLLCAVRTKYGVNPVQLILIISCKCSSVSRNLYLFFMKFVLGKAVSQVYVDPNIVHSFATSLFRWQLYFHLQIVSKTAHDEVRTELDWNFLSRRSLPKMQLISSQLHLCYYQIKVQLHLPFGYKENALTSSSMSWKSTNLVSNSVLICDRKLQNCLLPTSTLFSCSALKFRKCRSYHFGPTTEGQLFLQKPLTSGTNLPLPCSFLAI